jgi:UDP-glucose 4-epimerase
MKVLVTGGAGFIGSTVCSALVDAGHRPVVLDDLSTGRAEFVLGRPFYQGDVGDERLLDRVLADHPDLACTIHCAASIVVPDSVADPLGYYENNVARSVRLFAHLARRGRPRVLFSSSASIYAPAGDLVVEESSPIRPGSPYARTKAMVEQVLADSASAGALTPVSLRYFNPIGADPAMRTGLALARPSHALGRLIEAWDAGTPFPVTGVDWPTRDGTGIRDYVHVWDLARAHVLAVERFDRLIAAAEGGPMAINLGTGRGTTVRELVAAFRDVVGEEVATVDAPARAGDVAGAYARSRYDDTLLGWRPRHSLQDGIRHALAWRERWLDRRGARWTAIGA